MALTINVGDAPPSEFRIFAAGKNETTKGTYIFDEEAAREVMAAYHAHAVDVMIDLEHLSLEDASESRSFDPDARAWCKLELRGGELWAIEVSWTPDGEARLRDRRQRYISPAFLFDRETKRIEQLLNIGIVAMPATHNIAPLVAASARAQRLSGLGLEGDNIMTPEQYAKIAEALGLGADANVEDVLATIIAMTTKIKDAANGTTTDPAAEAEPLAATAPPAVAASRRVLAASRTLARLTGKPDIAQSIAEIEVWQKSHIEAETNRAKLAQERAALEGSERRRLVAEMVKLGAEVPATAWADDSATTPAEPWESMDMTKLRDRVAKLSKRGTGGGNGGGDNPPRTPKSGAADGAVTVTVRGEQVTLSASEVEACRDMNAKVEVFAANKLTRERALARNGRA